MNINLTPRMRNWISQLGAHVATASVNGLPEVFVSDQVSAGANSITINLNAGQRDLIAGNIAENSWVSLAPGKLGAIRAPYQIKGIAKLQNDQLLINVQEIYCTKPGDEAGIRLDVLEQTEIDRFDSSRWPDLNPPTN